MSTAAIRAVVACARVANRMAIRYNRCGFAPMAAEWRRMRTWHMTAARQLKADQPRTMERKQ